MPFQITPEIINKLDNFTTFRFLPIIRTNRPNPWNKYDSKPLRYITSNRDAFETHKQNLIEGTFTPRMRIGQEYAVQVRNKYNGQIFGIIAITTKHSENTLDFVWRQKIIQKTVSRAPCVSKGTKHGTKRKNDNYLWYSLKKKEVLKKLALANPSF